LTPLAHFVLRSGDREDSRGFECRLLSLLGERRGDTNWPTIWAMVSVIGSWIACLMWVKSSPQAANDRCQIVTNLGEIEKLQIRSGSGVSRVNAPSDKLHSTLTTNVRGSHPAEATIVRGAPSSDGHPD
jgi:hypothetical protein